MKKSINWFIVEGLITNHKETMISITDHKENNMKITDHKENKSPITGGKETPNPLHVNYLLYILDIIPMELIINFIKEHKLKTC